MSRTMTKDAIEHDMAVNSPALMARGTGGRLNNDPLTGHFIPPYDGWAPYCLHCETMGRMTPTWYGWKCEGKGDIRVNIPGYGSLPPRPGCGNTIGRNLRHVVVAE